MGKPRRAGRRIPRPTHTCTCGKKAYSAKKRAKHAVRVIHPDENMSVYECTTSTAGLPVWHFGHLDLFIRDRNHRMRDAAAGAAEHGGAE